MKRKMNKTKRKMNKTKRKMNKTRGKNIIREKRIRKRNKVNLHNKLMKGGAAGEGGVDANIFGIPVPKWLFHEPPQERESNFDGFTRLNKDPSFNILNILDFLGIQISPLARGGLTLIDFFRICDRIKPCMDAKKILDDMNFDIIENPFGGFNLKITILGFAIFLQQKGAPGSGLYESPGQSFNIKEILMNFLRTNGNGAMYSEEGINPMTVSVIEPLRNGEINIKFIYDTQKGELMLLREGNDAGLAPAELKIGSEPGSQLTRGVSTELERQESIPVDPT